MQEKKEAKPSPRKTRRVLASQKQGKAREVISEQIIISSDEETEESSSGESFQEEQPRRSRRDKNAPAFKKEEKEKQIQAILELSSDKKLGLQVVETEGKGRGIVTTRNISKGSPIVEYAGEVLNADQGKEREDTYPPSAGSYMYYIRHKEAAFW